MWLEKLTYIISYQFPNCSPIKSDAISLKNPDLMVKTWSNLEFDWCQSFSRSWGSFLSKETVQKLKDVGEFDRRKTSKLFSLLRTFQFILFIFETSRLQMLASDWLHSKFTSGTMSDLIGCQKIFVYFSYRPNTTLEKTLAPSN